MKQGLAAGAENLYVEALLQQEKDLVRVTGEIRKEHIVGYYRYLFGVSFVIDSHKLTYYLGMLETAAHDAVWVREAIALEWLAAIFRETRGASYQFEYTEAKPYLEAVTASQSPAQTKLQIQSDYITTQYGELRALAYDIPQARTAEVLAPLRAGLKSYADTLDEIRIEGLALIYQEVYQTSAAPDAETAALFLQTLREGRSFRWVRIQMQVRKDVR